VEAIVSAPFTLSHYTEFLQQVVEQYPYTVACACSDNGTEYKGTDRHAFVALCREQAIGQKFTRVKRAQTNGKLAG